MLLGSRPIRAYLVEKEFPAIKLVRGVRFVDNGKLVTAGGLTCGIDAALHVLDRAVGRRTTEMAVDYLEYRSSDWQVASRHPPVS